MDPKMDSGIVRRYYSEAIDSGAAPVPLSSDRTVDVQCVIAIMDHLLACEVAPKFPRDLQFTLKWMSSMLHFTRNLDSLGTVFFMHCTPCKRAHSISAREVIVCSSRGLTKPSTLLNAILWDVVICYDDTVRNVYNNSIIQFEYETKPRAKNIFATGEPVGVLAATQKNEANKLKEGIFGVVLLELIAGPKTVGKFGDGVDIVRWVKKTISELAQWVRNNKHHKPIQDCHHVRRQEAYDEGSCAHDHQSSSVHCGIASCLALAF
ncbi:hypothetical protein RHSIM_Rhsim10G0150400 [Rhododendron simsii]|uniref:Uncharacterized protein n=1 Tax=Rhododendron simsii TaxID=118357 RepID=A0A834LE53_RHOSS|nr:hypothetical protein RHSIM_Rhsim10G0150400 [Rhododendron simsii]